MRKYLIVLILILLLTLDGYAVNVKDYPSIDEAYKAVPWYGELYFPGGQYKLSGTFNIDKPISIRGDGKTTEIIGKDFDLIVVNPAKGYNFGDLKFSDIYLIGMTNKGNLLTLNRVGNSTISNVLLRGGDKGIFVNGCLRNDFNHIFTDTGYRNDTSPMTNCGIYADSDIVGNNANRYYNVGLRMCNTGMYLADSRGEGGVSVIGGTLEGNREKALVVKGMLHPVNIQDLHLESRGSGIDVTGCALVCIGNIYSSEPITLTGCGNVIIRNSYVNSIVSDADTNVDMSGVLEGMGSFTLPKGDVGNITSSSGGKFFNASSQRGNNIVPGDLEKWADGLPKSFGKYGNGEIMQNDKALFGKKCAYIKSTGSHIGLKYTISGNEYKILAGKKATISMYVKSDKETECALYVRFLGSGNYYLISPFTATLEWKKFSTMFIMEPRSSDAIFIWGMYQPQKDSAIYIDGIELVLGQGTSYVYDWTEDNK